MRGILPFHSPANLRDREANLERVDLNRQKGFFPGDIRKVVFIDLDVQDFGEPAYTAAGKFGVVRFAVLFLDEGERHERGMYREGNAAAFSIVEFARNKEQFTVSINRSTAARSDTSAI